MTIAELESVAARWSSDDEAGSFPVHEAATGRLLARIRAADAAEIDAAVRGAHRAFTEDWRHRTGAERGRMLRRAAQLLREHADEIAEIESREVGKPIEISRHYDMVVCAESFEFFGALADKIHGDFFPGGPIDTYTIREPYGVVAGIIPFNWPPVHTAAKAAPALAAGNVVVLKPPEQCPLTVLRITEILQEVFPGQVVQAVPGRGSEAGRALTGHPLVRRISFTGSPATGRAVLKDAAEHFTGALLELGGKCPLIVYEDADLDLAVSGAVEGTFFNQGEACTSASRVLVHDAVADEFIRRYIAATSRLVVGDGLDPRTHIGAMVTAEHKRNVEAFVETGQLEGAVLAFRGRIPDDPRLAGGYFVPPTVFTDVTPGMRIAREEIFGPVASVIRFATDEEAIEIANGTDFALVAAVYTQDDQRARRAGREIDAGVVFVNNYNRMFLGTPFGGNRASGYGREHAAETLQEFLRTKSVRTPSGRSQVPTWSGARGT
ncbi:aldehyde dehydrogenase family protein [Wenjunlia tyrosinilytica]|uniref:Phenylacetaldehyde dehydrogenase n=1 Tax=Wenjunlia tyrosinilytica TaxID=1544741 RepID=A0A917ZUT3_9ACTN|nr:aldehyde dehydrogenase family protein [Wenjunlia tyrosinilytica]GGO94749.1 phenylacetaldehyde dehydrogenase [Wenjunlia tyrosinilytica]